MPAGARPDAQTFTIAENCQEVSVELPLCLHAPARPATLCFETEHAPFGARSQAQQEGSQEQYARKEIADRLSKYSGIPVDVLVLDQEDRPTMDEALSHRRPPRNPSGAQKARLRRRPLQKLDP